MVIVAWNHLVEWTDGDRKFVDWAVGVMWVGMELLEVVSPSKGKKRGRMGWRRWIMSLETRAM